MKIIVCYVSAGAGHRRIAEAVFKEISEKIKDIRIIDALDYTNPIFEFIYKKGYYFLSVYLPRLWGFLFLICDLRYLSLPIDFIRFSINRLNSKRLSAFLKKEAPDIVISTHFFVNEVVGHLKERGKIRSFLLSVITDFCAHRFWIQKNVDLYVVGLKKTKDELIKKGVFGDKIKVLGIPVDRRFYSLQDKRLLCQSLGLREDLFTVLVVTGTIGVNRIERIVDCLQDEIQTICVCGINKRLYRRLMNKGYKFTKIYGLVENMDELMSVCDLVITKPGGSTISEALVKCKPLIFISVIGGQEERNAKIMEDFGIGKIPKDTEDLRKIVFYLKENRKELEGIKEKNKKIPKFNPYLWMDLIGKYQNAICKSSYSFTG